MPHTDEVVSSKMLIKMLLTPLILLEIKSHQCGSSLGGELFPVDTRRCSDGTH